MNRLGQFDRRCPCTSECEERSIECRKECSKYAEYARMKAEEYSSRLAIWRTNCITPSKERACRHKERNIRSHRYHER